MFKTMGWVVAGVAIGIAVAKLTVPSASGGIDTESEGVDAVADADAAAAGTREDAALAERLSALEARVAELADELERDTRRSQQSVASDTAPPETQADRLPRFEAAQRVAIAEGAPGFQTADGLVSRLVDGGFTTARAEWIQNRKEELAVAQMQARYAAQRNGEPAPPDDFAGFGAEHALRMEIGDVEYEQYLKALGRPTEVNVMGVLAGSPAEQAGIRPGDRIVSYAGTRVFDTREISPLTLEGNPGESVLVDIEREGQRLTVVVPRGPLGLNGSLNTITIFRAEGP
jgi:membrane-associated protease RseP (regulator of RpoE activity)